MNFSQSTKERSAVKHLLKVINPLILHNLSYYLDVEQFLVASNSATEASIFKLVLPDCDIHDTGKPMCSVIRLSLSAENLNFFHHSLSTPCMSVYRNSNQIVNKFEIKKILLIQ